MKKYYLGFYLIILFSGQCFAQVIESVGVVVGRSIDAKETTISIDKKVIPALKTKFTGYYTGLRIDKFFGKNKDSNFRFGTEGQFIFNSKSIDLESIELKFKDLEGYFFLKPSFFILDNNLSLEFLLGLQGEFTFDQEALQNSDELDEFKNSLRGRFAGGGSIVFLNGMFRPFFEVRYQHGAKEEQLGIEGKVELERDLSEILIGVGVKIMFKKSK